MLWRYPVQYSTLLYGLHQAKPANGLSLWNSTCLARRCCRSPLNDRDRASLARNILRAEMMWRGMSHAKLVEALAAIEIEETEAGWCYTARGPMLQRRSSHSLAKSDASGENAESSILICSSLVQFRGSNRRSRCSLSD